MMEGLGAALFMVVAVAGVLWLYILLPSEMAKKRGRSATAWVLVSLFFSVLQPVYRHLPASGARGCGRL